jgi:hypothetical protein
MFDSHIAKFTSDDTLNKKWNTDPLCRGISVDSSDIIWITSANKEIPIIWYKSLLLLEHDKG